MFEMYNRDIFIYKGGNTFGSDRKNYEDTGRTQNDNRGRYFPINQFILCFNGKSYSILLGSCVGNNNNMWNTTGLLGTDKINL